MIHLAGMWIKLLGPYDHISHLNQFWNNCRVNKKVIYRSFWTLKKTVEKETFWKAIIFYKKCSSFLIFLQLSPSFPIGSVLQRLSEESEDAATWAGHKRPTSNAMKRRCRLAINVRPQTYSVTFSRTGHTRPTLDRSARLDPDTSEVRHVSKREILFSGTPCMWQF